MKMDLSARSPCYSSKIYLYVSDLVKFDWILALQEIQAISLVRTGTHAEDYGDGNTNSSVPMGNQTDSKQQTFETPMAAGRKRAHSPSSELTAEPWSTRMRCTASCRTGSAMTSQDCQRDEVGQYQQPVQNAPSNQTPEQHKRSSRHHLWP